VIVLHAAVAVAAIILLILVPKVNPVFALMIGSLYLGITANLGLVGTLETIVLGFGEMMTDVGLLVAFGVLLGGLLNSLGALQGTIDKLMSLLGPKRLPYGFGLVLSTIFPSIFTDTQVVLGAPIVRASAKRMGPNGLALMSGTLGASAFVANFIVLPGLGTLLIAGLLGSSIGTVLVYGFIVGPVSVVVTVAVWSWLLKRGFWNPARDESVEDAEELDGGVSSTGGSTTSGSRDDEGLGGLRTSGLRTNVMTAERKTVRTLPPLYVSVLPIVIPLVLMVSAATASAAGYELSLLSFVGHPVFALFLGVCGAYLLSRRTFGKQQVEETISKGFHSMGSILVITGVGGSFGAIIAASTLGDTLVEFFSIDSAMPVLLVVLFTWVVSAVLHLSTGSTGVAAITAAGILAPVAATLDMPVELIGIAIGSGVLFAVHVNANIFWLFKSLLGLTTRGALKSYTLVTSLVSVVSLVFVLLLGLVVA
jgi:gluconate:H+ symporter, GntP family